MIVQVTWMVKKSVYPVCMWRQSILCRSLPYSKNTWCSESPVIESETNTSLLNVCFQIYCASNIGHAEQASRPNAVTNPRRQRWSKSEVHLDACVGVASCDVKTTSRIQLASSAWAGRSDVINQVTEIWQAGRNRNVRHRLNHQWRPRYSPIAIESEWRKEKRGRDEEHSWQWHGRAG